ncbi:SPJ_0845 family protein [Streptococcus orisasini]|nr:SPJ_0845 family protein [Streptococcus orisasini]
MAITFKKKDELEKMMENFAKLPDLEKAESPDDKDKEKENDKNVKK